MLDATVRCVATAYIRAYPVRYTVLGTDGYGRSDARAKLRRHLEVGRYHVAHAAIAVLAAERKMAGEGLARAIKLYKIDTEQANLLGPSPRPPADVVQPRAAYAALGSSTGGASTAETDLDMISATKAERS